MSDEPMTMEEIERHLRTLIRRPKPSVLAIQVWMRYFAPKAEPAAVDEFAEYDELARKRKAA